MTSRHPERSAPPLRSDSDAREGSAVPRSVPRAIALSLITPLLEKNVLKTISLDIPVVFSMSRVIVLAFAVALVRQIWRAGIAGWPDATLAVAIVLALPIVAALDRVKPSEMLPVVSSLLGRLGVGGARPLGSVYGSEPSKFDDHRID
jgi:hypothetical protein